MKKNFKFLCLGILIASCNNFGEKVTSGNIEIYYKDGIKKAEAEKTASTLHNLEKSAGNDVSGTKSFQLSNFQDTVLAKMVSDQAKSKSVIEESFQAIGNIISDSVFQGKPVNLELTNTKFETYRHVTYKKLKDEDFADFGKKYSSEKIELYVQNDMSDTSAQKLADYLNSIMKPAQTVSFQTSLNDNGVFVLKMASNPDLAAKVADEAYKQVASLVSTEFLEGKPVIFELSTPQFKSFKSFSSGEK
jgi:predicted metalloenzyme YecM